VQAPAVSLEVVWFYSLALIKTHLILKKSVLDPQHIISSLNFDRSSRTLHRMAASGSLCVSLFHAGLKSEITNSKTTKKQKKYKTFTRGHFV
jgi:hypothetical protein